LQNEPLAETIRKDTTIHGIEVGELGNRYEIKISAYADDTQGYVRDRESINKWFIWLYVYSRATGAKVNLEKTTGTALGPLKQEDNLHNSIQWTKGPVSVLGVNQGILENSEAYWTKKVDKMEKVLTQWKRRNLTYTGKIHLVRSVGLSILQYAWDVKTIPDKFIKEIERAMWAFIWDGKPERVKREVCRRKRTEGGLGVPDVRKLIDASRIKLFSKIIDPGDEKWKILPRFFIGLLNKNEEQIMTSLSSPARGNFDKSKCPTLYRECIQAWSTIQRDGKFQGKT
jgi:hypothetical protein